MACSSMSTTSSITVSVHLNFFVQVSSSAELRALCTIGNEKVKPAQCQRLVKEKAKPARYERLVKVKPARYQRWWKWNCTISEASRLDGSTGYSHVAAMYVPRGIGSVEVIPSFCIRMAILSARNSNRATPLPVNILMRYEFYQELSSHTYIYHNESSWIYIWLTNSSGMT